MKKLILLSILFIVGCDKYAPTDHTHINDGVCISRDPYSIGDGIEIPFSVTYECFPNYSEVQCITNDDQNPVDETGGWWYFYNMTCEEFCAQTPSDEECTIKD